MTRDEKLEIEADEEIKNKRLELEREHKKKTFSIIFMCIMSILSAVLACVVLVVVLLGLVYLINRFVGDNDTAGRIYSVVMLVAFIGTIAMGVVFYKMLARFSIRRFRLEKKLPKDVYEYFMVKKQKKNLKQE